jgi:CDP-paratose 2-epimerase
MPVAVVTGSAGLVGSETVRFFAGKGFQVVGVDNNMRSVFFGEEASTLWQKQRLLAEVPGYLHRDADIRDRAAMEALFAEYGSDIRLVVHAAAQPSHDWAARDPHTDFSVNANGTLTLLEATRKYCPQAVFIFTSTNKVYGDSPNRLPLVERETRWEVDPVHPYAEHGIDEQMSIDQTTHSLFGASKVAADVLTQEYGRYFGMKTGVFRGGCLTGPNHSGTMLHGFLAYLMKCAVSGEAYTIFGYKGKQVRDNIHSQDLVNMFWHFYSAPRPGEVYNAGGSRFSNCSMREAIQICEEIAGRRMNVTYIDQARSGDHIWYVSDVRKFRGHYPHWEYRFTLAEILQQIFAGIGARRSG